MKIKRFFKYFGISIAILICGFLVAGQITYHSTPIIEPPGTIYSVDGVKMHLYCTGLENDERPTIIIIAGGGTQSPFYYNLQEDLSNTVRTCSYDRAGSGWSEPNDVPPTAKNMSNELYQLLQTVQIDGPIILTGHSLGGLVSLIYSAEHEEQVVGIAFIDSSHYNQLDYFGKEYRDVVTKQSNELLASFWLIELLSQLGILNMLTTFQDTSELEINDEEKKMMAYFDRWTSPYTAIKSESSNFELSLEQAKEAHFSRGDLPIISISASGIIPPGFPETVISGEEWKRGFKTLHKELADLSINGRHVVVDGTDHMSIVYNDETADHILSIIPEINDNYPIDSRCDWFLVHQLEFQLPEPSQWYLDNFYEEYNALRTLMKDEQW